MPLRLRFKLIPLLPTEILASPFLEKLSLTPGSSLMLFLYLNPMGAFPAKITTRDRIDNP